MRQGIFGGTFDPIHLGHLILAEQCREQARLDQVLFVPAARPPHKQHQALTPFEKRVDMLRLAVSGQPAFRVEDLEKDRPGPSYTADTLRILKERQPANELFLILGADSLNDLPGWYEPRDVIELATLLIVARPGWEMPPLTAVWQALGRDGAEPVRIEIVHCPLIDISSRDLRQRVAAGQTIRYMVPRAVEAYVQDKKLYQTR